MANNQGAGGGGAPDPNAGRGLRDNLVSSELAARELSQDLGYALENLAKAQKLLEKQAKSYTGLVGSSQLLNYLAKDNLKFAQDLTQMYENETQVSNDVLLKRNMIGTQLQGEYAQLLTTYMLENDITDVNDNKVQLLIKQLKHRQETNEKLTEERDLYESIASQMLEIREEADSYGKKLKGVLATARAIGNDPKAMGGLLLQQGAAKLEAFTEGFKGFREEGVSAGQAIQAQMNTINVESVLGLSDMKGAQQGVIEAYGNVNAVSKETLSNIGSMAHHFGIAGTEAAAINASLSQIPGETSESAAHAMEMTGHLAEMQGIAPGKIMKDMAKNTGEMARAGAKGAEEFGKSVVALHKMGMEMSTASKIADGLLDFESSINAQMEASALLGREINLDKARELALNNDLKGMAAEISKQVGGSAGFAKMNRLEQDLFAKSVNMSTEELVKMMDAQEESNKYSGEGAGLANNAMGKMLEYGSAAGGFFKENGLLLLASLQFLTMGNGLQLVGNALQFGKNILIAAGNGLLLVGKGIAFATSLIWDAERRKEAFKMVKTAAFWLLEKGHMGFMIAKAGVLKALGLPGADKAQAAVTKLKDKAADKLKEKGGDLANKAAGGVADKAGGVADKAGGVADKAGGGATDLAAKSQKVPNKKGGVGTALKDVASGLKAFGNPKVLGGALTMLVAAPALLIMVASLPFLALISMIGVPAGVGLKALAGGVKSFGSGKVLMGAGVMAAAATAILALGAATILFAQGGVAGTALMIVSLIALTIALAVLGGLGLSGVGFIGVALVLAVGVAMLLLGAAVLLAAIGIAMVVDSFTKMFEVVSMENIGALLLLGPALALIGVGMLVMAVGLLIAAPALLLFGVAAFVASFGVGALGIGFALLGIGVAMVAGSFFLMSKVLNKDFVSLLAELVPVTALLGLGLLSLGLSALVAAPGLLIGSLSVGLMAAAVGVLAMALTAAIPGLLVLIQLGSMVDAFAQIAVSMASMALGITAFAAAGLLTLPTVMGLIALSFVAPILTALGDSINYDLEGGSSVQSKPEDDKMSILIEEVRGLKAIMAQGGVINMDGKKVGDVLRLGTSTSNLR